MHKKRTTISLLGAVAMVSSLLLPQLAWSEHSNAKYRVTITNLTAGQPFSPPVLVTHTSRASIFSVGEDASFEIQEIAENGNGTPLVTALSGNTETRDVVAGTAPIIPANNPGGAPFNSSESYEITTRGRARYLSIAAMLICTNDGFTGVDSVRLPYRSTTVYAVAYDARTEQNTEDFADIVPPCQGLIGVTSDDAGTGMTNPLLSEEGVVIPHAGVNGGTDLQPGAHNWGDPVAKIVIERIRR